MWGKEGTRNRLETGSLLFRNSSCTKSVISQSRIRGTGCFLLCVCCKSGASSVFPLEDENMQTEGCICFVNFLSLSPGRDVQTHWETHDVPEDTTQLMS